MPEEIQKKLIEDEMKESYVDYAMSVIVSRALPDVRDGLKPVHRRILYAMHQIGLKHNKAFKKSANVVGNVMARFHPHGDSAIYETMVRMSQDFSLRYPLVDGQGNWGSQDGDNAAAYRYTEARMQKIAEEILLDIEKETVNFIPNYDGSTEEPAVLPSKVPNLLVNGSSGIAVGMATNMAPHNMGEVCDAIIASVDNPDISISDLMNIIPGPDFPTGGYICGRSGIRNAYNSGRGRLVLRAKTNIELKGDKKRIIVTETPYQVNKAAMVETIANNVRDKKIEGIRDIRDESNREGIRVVFDLKKGFDENIVLNQIYHNSQLQTTFGIINIALVDGQPKLMGLKDLIKHHIDHRKKVIIRRTKFDLTNAEEKNHILEGLRIALTNIDPVIKTIKSSKDAGEAKRQLRDCFKLTEKQTQAILDMKLQRLTSLEHDKINSDYNNTVKLIQKLEEILSSDQKILGIIKKDLADLKNVFGDSRRTEIIEEEEEIDIEDMIPEEQVVVNVTHSGYIKKIPVETYKKQKRGGKGVKGTGLKDEDAVEHLFTTSNHNYVLFFTNKGKVHWLKAYNIPTASRYSRGKAIVNLLVLGKDEKVTALVPVSSFDDNHFLLMATKKGLVKKTSIMEYSRPRRGGIAAIKLKDGDDLVKVLLTPGILDIIIATKKGMAVKFNEKDVLPIGRIGRGVRGIRLKNKGDEVIGMDFALDSAALLTITENGYGKKTKMDEYTLIKRGGSGVINIKTTERNGNVVGIRTVEDTDEILVVTKNGQMIRIPVKGISTIGRATLGVRIMKLGSGDKVTSISRVVAKSEE